MEQRQSLGKLFIGGLSWETSSEKLREYYEKFGELTDSVVMRDRDNGNPRGFGFVTYKDETIAEQVAASVHELDGRKVDTKLAVNRDGAIPAGHGGDTAVPEASPKLFIGGVSPMSTEGSLLAYFNKFGEVLEVVLMKDHHTGASRGFGFVTFKDTAAADECVKQARYHNIDDKQVEVKSAETRQERTKVESSKGVGKGYGKGKCKGYTGDRGKGGGGPMRGSWLNGGHTDGYGGGKGYGDSYGGGKGYGDNYGGGKGYSGDDGGGYADWGGRYGGGGDSYGGGKGYGDSYGGGKGYGNSYGGGGDSYGGGKGYGDSYGGGKGYGNSYRDGKRYGGDHGGGYDGYGSGGYGDGYGGHSGYGSGKGAGDDSYADVDALDYNTGAGANDNSAASALESVMGALAGQLSGGGGPAADSVSTDNNRYHPYSRS